MKEFKVNSVLLFIIFDIIVIGVLLFILINLVKTFPKTVGLLLFIVILAVFSYFVHILPSLITKLLLTGLCWFYLTVWFDRKNYWATFIIVIVFFFASPYLYESLLIAADYVDRCIEIFRR